MDLWTCQAGSDFPISDETIPSLLGVDAAEARALKQAVVERGLFAEDWSPLVVYVRPLPAPSDPGRPSGGARLTPAEKQARYRERRDRRRALAEAGRELVTEEVTSVTDGEVTKVTSVTGPRVTKVTRVTGGNIPPHSPPNKRLNTNSNVQDSSNTHSQRVCVTDVTRGNRPELDRDERPEPKPACTHKEQRRLQQVARMHFDPLALTDVWSRHVDQWSITYPASWIEEVIPIVARQAARDAFTREPYGRRILERWAAAGGPPAPESAPIGPDAPARLRAVGAGEAVKPPSAHQKRMATYGDMAARFMRDVEDEEQGRGEANHAAVT